jgi:hypothetical protein
MFYFQLHLLVFQLKSSSGYLCVLLHNFTAHNWGCREVLLCHQWALFLHIQACAGHHTLHTLSLKNHRVISFLYRTFGWGLYLAAFLAVFSYGPTIMTMYYVVLNLSLPFDSSVRAIVPS